MLLSRWSVGKVLCLQGHDMPNACTGSNPTSGNFAFFLLRSDARKVCLHVFEMCGVFLNNLRLKLGQNNIEASFTRYSTIPYNGKFSLAQIFAYLAKKPTV